MKFATHLSLAAGLLITAQASFAHDPAMHAAEAAAAKVGPDCAAMAKMDSSKMVMNDPVIMAMQMKCTSAKPPTKGKDAPMDHSKMPGMSHDMPMPEHGGY